ncbi:DUF2480 family protein [uncultured Tenacibaculum sp.]|uniref:DUF2480 family protein n=1 Tax=uncultured Tenacibaculum sp. TaxID=174713 RepID=UPI0026220F14|nr:DUF2480 family protein [uncultured Tenacibaculum sp.]
MADEIVNRVANSKLVTFDLEDYYVEGKRVLFDISDWLFEGLLLKEKDFRAHVKNHDWSQYEGAYVALHCATDAIIPSWAYLLVSTELYRFANKVVIGNLELLETVLFTEIINTLSLDTFQDKPVIIKGCSNKPIPESAYPLLISKIQPVAKSIMYGEACSTVPLYKKK